MHRTSSAALGLMTLFTFPVGYFHFLLMRKSTPAWPLFALAWHSSETFLSSSHFSEPDYIPYSVANRRVSFQGGPPRSVATELCRVQGGGGAPSESKKRLENRT